MATFPRTEQFDTSLALLREGYHFISNRVRRYHSDAFRTRLLLQEATCVLGADAARMFYEPDRFTRQGALPPTTLRLLQDKGSVFTLDGAAHRDRKQMFLEMLTPPEQIAGLVAAFDEQWRASQRIWETREAIVLNDEMQPLLLRAVCQWADVPLTEASARRRTREINAMLTYAGVASLRVLGALLLRRRTERWCQRIIRAIRDRHIAPAPGTAAHTIAWRRDLDDALLDVDIAAVELVNILRPVVAIAWFVTFAALALHEHPAWRARLLAGDDGELTRFVQEVRRFYPFFPMTGGRALHEFAWRGEQVAPGSWVLLDLYGTDHDGRIWDDPDAFRPDRFLAWDGSAYDFIPQGGGDYLTGHRCPGETITIAIMKAATRHLLTAIDYDVPAQDLSIDLSRFPPLPASRFVMAHVRPAS